MFGGKVNKNGTNLCKAGEECQAGTTASSGEEGEGKFHAWHFGSFIAVGATGTVYVGDENRVQEFNANGEYQAQIKLPGFGTVTMLAVNSSRAMFSRARLKPTLFTRSTQRVVNFTLLISQHHRKSLPSILKRVTCMWDT